MRPSVLMLSFWIASCDGTRDRDDLSHSMEGRQAALTPDVNAEFEPAEGTADGQTAEVDATVSEDVSAGAADAASPGPHRMQRPGTVGVEPRMSAPPRTQRTTGTSRMRTARPRTQPSTRTG
jgi:hypothetical protein